MQTGRAKVAAKVSREVISYTAPNTMLSYTLKELPAIQYKETVSVIIRIIKAYFFFCTIVFIFVVFDVVKIKKSFDIQTIFKAYFL